MSTTYTIDAFWDAEAKVWVATSEDVIGLVTEAPTIEHLTQKLHAMIAELMELNHVLAIAFSLRYNLSYSM
jgi:Domain of unknown function (DUF1902)